MSCSEFRLGTSGASVKVGGKGRGVQYSIAVFIATYLQVFVEWQFEEETRACGGMICTV